MTRRRYVLWVLSGLFLGAAAAAELSFSADVDQTTVGLGDQMQLTVTVTGSNIGGVPKPQLPDLADFTQLGSTSSQSTNISFVNGRMSQEQTTSFIYFLSPKRVGNLFIGPCKLDFKGMTYQTQPIAVTATKESQAPPPRQRQPSMPSPFGFPSQPQPRGGGGNVRLAASADRTSVYPGEQVTVGFTIYTQAQIANLGMKEAPGFSGFWVENLFEAKDLKYSAETHEGQRYNAAPIRRVALFPTQAGDLRVDKMTLSGQKIVGGGFFFDSSEPFEVSSDPITIHVKPLPAAGRPADFGGGAGSFQVSAALSKDSSTGGEPLTLSIKVSGAGNIGLIGQPQLPPVAGVKVLTPETKDDISTSGGRVSGTRTFSFPLIPTADGKYAIPGISMSFFDPRKGSYYTLSTQPLAFVATGTTGKVAASENEAGVRVLGSDIVHIKTAMAATSTAAGSWFWLFYPAGFVVLAAGAVAGRHRRRLDADRGYARRSRSSRLVRARLAEAARLLASGNERDYYAALSRAVVGYAGDRFNIEASGMTGDQLREEMARRGVADETVAALLGLVSDCDAARFSPGMARCSPQETLRKARLILEKL